MKFRINLFAIVVFTYSSLAIAGDDAADDEFSQTDSYLKKLSETQPNDCLQGTSVWGLPYRFCNQFLKFTDIQQKPPQTFEQYNPPVNPDAFSVHDSKGSFKELKPVDTSGLVGKNFFDVFTTFDSSKSDQEQSFTISDQSGLEFTMLYTPARTPSDPMVAIRMEGLDRNLAYINLDKNFKVTGVGKHFQIRHGLEVALNVMKATPGIDSLAQAIGMQTDYSAGDIQDKIEDLHSARKEQETHRKDVKQKLTELKKNEYKLEHIEDSNSGLAVLQQEFATEKYRSESTIKALKTFGAGPCVILAIYDPSEKVASLAHIDATTDVDKALHQMVESMQSLGSSATLGIDSDSSGTRPIKVYMAGGNSESQEQVFEILNQSKKIKNAEISSNVLSGTLANAWIDLESGKIFSVVKNYSLESNKRQPLISFVIKRALRRVTSD